MAENTALGERVVIPPHVPGPREQQHQPSASIQEGIDNAFRSWATEEQPLPILSKRREIASAFHAHDRSLLEADTGSGKSTAALVIILNELLKTNPDARILSSQPRKIATEGITKYIGEKIGPNYVAYRHRKSPRQSPDARIISAVEGSVLKELRENPTLDGFDALHLDEAQEPSEHMAMIMALTKQAQQKRAAMGKPLKLVLTSATIDVSKMQKYFPGMHHEKIPGGKRFDVKPHFLDDPLKKRPDGTIDVGEVINAAVQTVGTILKEPREKKQQGAIVLFMPGRAEIETTMEELRKQITDPTVDIVPLLGGEDSGDVDVYQETPGRRKVIVATNVAQTSITIPGVTDVIDSGLMRTNIYNEKTGITELVTLPHTQSDARQREGRAGRVIEGHVHYLFTKEEFAERDEFLPPKILQINLASQVLLMKDMGIQDIYNFDFIDPPEKEKIDQAIQSLQKLGALDKNGDMTEIGKQMMEYDTDPHFARMLVEAEKRNCSEAISLLIGLMSSRSSVFDRDFKPDTPFGIKYGQFLVPHSDFLTHLRVWNDYVEHNTATEERKAWALKNGIKTIPLYLASKDRRDLFSNKPDIRQSLGQKPIELTEQTMKDISICIASGLIEQSLQQEQGSSFKPTYRYNKSGKTGIILDRDSVLNAIPKDRRPSQLLSGNIRTIEAKKDKPEQTIARFNTAMLPEWIKEAAPYLFPNNQPDEKSPAMQPSTEQPKKAEPVKTAVVSSPTQIRPLPERPAFSSNGHHPAETPRQEPPPTPKNLWERAKQIAYAISAPVRSVWRFLKRLFTGH